MFRKLTRIPSSTFSEDLFTGEPAFDDFLRRLDAELLGRASLRRVTLDEVRDHLLEQQAVLMDQGLATDAAARQALEGFGSVKTLGAEQRRDVKREFFKHLVLLGLVFASFMAVFELVSPFYGEFSGLDLAARFGFNFTFYGLFMSFFITFSRFDTGGVKPTSGRVATANGIEVYSSRKSRIVAAIMLLFGASMTVICLLGFMGIGIGRLYGLYGNLLMLYFGVFMMSNMLACWTRLSLDGDQLGYHSLFRRRTFRIAEVKVFKRQGLGRIYLPPAFGRTHKLTLVTDKGEMQTLYFSLNADMQGSDRLIARLEAMKRPGEMIAYK